MIKTYKKKDGKLYEGEADFSTLTKKDIIWFDMISPDAAEERNLEEILGIDAPTPKEMQELESSSRLYAEGGAIYLTTTLVTQADSENPQTKSVTFIVKDKVLVTLRYSDPKAFTLFLNRASRISGSKIEDGFQVFLGLMEAVIDRLSDSLEMIGKNLDETSHIVFQNNGVDEEKNNDLQNILKNIGRQGDLNGKIRESLLSLSRVFSYLLMVGSEYKAKHKEVLDTYAKDISSLSEHATYISNKVNLLLDATLGLINIEQNAIIKIFSVAAVVFLPPTLIASIYGMNYKYMPELDWLFGYPFAIGLMIVSAILPFCYFKYRRWL